jgi:hypothetical protein
LSESGYSDPTLAKSKDQIAISILWLNLKKTLRIYMSLKFSLKNSSKFNWELMSTYAGRNISNPGSKIPFLKKLFMPIKDQHCFESILEAIDRIIEYTSGIKSADDFNNDYRNFDATMMNFVVIGK